MKEIFISYAKDCEKNARQLAYDLRIEFKDWRIDIDDEQSRRIRRAFVTRQIQRCDHFLVFISKEGFEIDPVVQEEIAIALETYKKREKQRNFIIPLRVDECNLSNMGLDKFEPADYLYSRNDFNKKVYQIIAKSKVLRRIFMDKIVQGAVGGVVGNMLWGAIKPLASFISSMSGVQVTPEHNIKYTPISSLQSLKKFQFLPPRAKDGEERWIKMHGASLGWSYIAFFMDVEGALIDHTGAPIPLSGVKIEEIPLVTPIGAKIILVALGDSEQLERVKEKLENGAPLDKACSDIFWLMYGEGGAAHEEPREDDVYFQFKKILLEADLETDVGEKSKYLNERGAFFKRISESLKTARDWVRFGAVQRALNAETLNRPSSFFAFAPSEEACRMFEEHHPEITAQYAELNIERAENLLKSARRKQPRLLDRHHHAENAIRMIHELMDDADQWPHHDVKWPGREHIPSASAACRFISECYLLRSSLVHVKGESIPVIKLEALKKAWEWACRSSADPDELKAEIVLEQRRWDPNYPPRNARTWLLAFANYCSKKWGAMDFERPLHQEVNDTLHRLDALNDNVHLSERFTRFDNDLVNRGKEAPFHYRLPLLQARAAIRLGRARLTEWLDRAVNMMERRGAPLSLSNPLWGDTVDVISRVAEDDANKGQWERAAIQAWEICRKEEDRLGLSVQGRCYWAGQKRLYDLAVEAAVRKNNAIKAAEIADAHKSRPSMKNIDLERSLRADDLSILKKHLEADAQDFEDAYIVALGRRKEEKKLVHAPPPGKETSPRPLTEVPDGWAAVHFYIANQEKAWAIIVKKGARRIVALEEIQPLWRVFCEWDSERLSKGIAGDIDPALKALLWKIGDMLQPVLEEVGDENILFIPHGFLHLTPLHAALVKKNANDAADGKKRGENESDSKESRPARVHLFELKNCLFLPAWSLPAMNPGATGKKGVDILKSNFPDDRLRDLAAKGWSDENVIHNTPDEVIEALKGADAIRVFALYCHGQGDMVNPYNARFLLKGGPLTYMRLRRELPRMDGARVLVTACESDLVSENAGPADEHMTPASVFLERGAVEVVGTLFECNADFAMDLLLEVKDHPAKPVHEVLRNLQIRRKTGPVSYFTPFRVMGAPFQEENVHV